jgi:hypothetical protein
MSSYEVENIFDDLKKGKISEMDAEWSLRRENSSSCMRSEISRIVRDTEYGRYDSFDASREFERAERQCKRRSDEQRKEDEYWGY